MVDEVADRPAQRDHRLPDMDQLGGPVADDVDAQDRAGLAVEEQLEPPDGVADDPPSRDLAIVGDAHLVGHLGGGELLLGPAHERHLGDRVDAVREERRHRRARQAEGARGGHPPLLHGHRGEVREAHHVARRVDVRHRGAEAAIDRQPAARVGPQPGRLQVEALGVALASGCAEQGLRVELLPARQVRDHVPALAPLHALHHLAEPEGHARAAHVVHERVHDLAVEEVEQPLPRVHHRHRGAEGREHAGVLHPDHAAAHHDHAARHVAKLEQSVGVDDRTVVDRHPERPDRRGAGGDHEPLRPEQVTVPGRGDHDRVRVEEARLTLQHVDAVTRELGPIHVDLALDHVVAPEHEVGHRHLRLHPIRDAVEAALVDPRQIEHRLAQGLRGDRAGVHAHPADHRLPFHDRGAPAQLRSLDGRVVPGGAAADDDQLVVAHGGVMTSGKVDLGASVRSQDL